MSTTKFLLAAVAAAAVTLPARGEVNFWDEGTPEKTVTYGARVGLNVSSLGGDFDWDSKAGLQLGAAVDWHLINSISINTGLYFTMKGAKANYTEIEADGSNYFYNSAYHRLTYNALEIPVYVNYHFTVAPESTVQVFFGPYFDLGVYGRELLKYNIGNKEIQESASLFGGDEGGCNRFNMGVGLGAAYTWHRCQVALSYQWGCTHAAKEYDGSWNNFAITLGYNF